MKSFTMEYNDTSIRYVSKKRLNRHKRKNLILKIPAKIIYRFEYDDTRTYMILFDSRFDKKEFFEAANFSNGSLIFSPINYLNDSGSFEKISRRFTTRRDYLERFRRISFEENKANFYILFHRTEDYNLFKLSL